MKTTKTRGFLQKLETLFRRNLYWNVFMHRKRDQNSVSFQLIGYSLGESSSSRAYIPALPPILIWMFALSAAVYQTVPNQEIVSWVIIIIIIIIWRANLIHFLSLYFYLPSLSFHYSCVSNLICIVCSVILIWTDISNENLRFGWFIGLLNQLIIHSITKPLKTIVGEQFNTIYKSHYVFALWEISPK